MSLDLRRESIVDNHVAALDRDRELMHRQMLSSVSHDLKTPLASIIGSLEVIERMKAALTEEQKVALIGVALQEAYRLDNFITNILDMAKFDIGLVKPTRETVDVSSLIRDALIKQSHRLRESTVNFKGNQAFIVETDGALLARVVSLILDNAVKYGSVPSTIDISLAREERGVVIHIRNRGNDIPPEQVEAIFSKYTRFVKEDQQNAGTGLGLAISRSIMNLLNGDITVTNHSEGGAVFTLHFPIR